MPGFVDQAIQTNQLCWVETRKVQTPGGRSERGQGNGRSRGEEAAAPTGDKPTASRGRKAQEGATGVGQTHARLMRANATVALANATARESAQRMPENAGNGTSTTREPKARASTSSDPGKWGQQQDGITARDARTEDQDKHRQTAGEGHRIANEDPPDGKTARTRQCPTLTSSAEERKERHQRVGNNTKGRAKKPEMHWEEKGNATKEQW